MGLTVLDASIVIAVLDDSDPHHAAARAALEVRRPSGDRLVLPASAYAETLVGASRAGPEAVETIDAFLAAVPVTVEAATAAVAKEAANLRSEHGRRLPLPDAFVVGTALALSADRVLTADRSWPDLPIAVELVRGGHDEAGEVS